MPYNCFVFNQLIKNNVIHTAKPNPRFGASGELSYWESCGAGTVAIAAGIFAWNKMSSGALSLGVFPLVFSAEDLPSV